MRRALAVALINAVAAIAHRVLDGIVAHTTCEHAPDSWPLTDEEARDYHATWTACVLEGAADREGWQSIDFAPWESECMAGGEQA